MRTALLTASVLMVISVTGCQKESRRRTTTRGGSLAGSAANQTSAAAAFAFMSIDEALNAARQALADERWADALANSQQALASDPANAEAQQIADKAKAEVDNKKNFDALMTAVSRTDPAGFALAAKIPETSSYFAKAQTETKTLRDKWIKAQEAEAVAYSTRKNCEKIPAVERKVLEVLPDASTNIDEIYARCKQADLKELAEKKEQERKLLAQNDKREKAERDKHETAGLTSNVPTETKTEKEKAIEAKGIDKTTTTDKTAIEKSVEKTQPEKSTTTEKTVEKIEKPVEKVAEKTVETAKVETEKTKPTPPADVKPKTVAPSTLEGNRIAGKKNIEPTASMRQEMASQHETQLKLTAKVCVGTNGSVSSVKLVKKSVLGSYDRLVESEIKKWKYKPYMVNGTAVPVCTNVIFNVTMN